MFDICILILYDDIALQCSIYPCRVLYFGEKLNSFLPSNTLIHQCFRAGKACLSCVEFIHFCRFFQSTVNTVFYNFGVYCGLFLFFFYFIFMKAKLNRYRLVCWLL